MKHMEDHMQYVILHFNFILTTTTSSLLLLLYLYTPPKIFSKFKNKFLSGIMSNTWWAEREFMPMLSLGLDQVQPWPPLLPWSITSPISTSA